MQSAELQAALESFLAASPQAAVVEEGEVLFDFASGARYSVTEDRGRTLLQLWSAERNVVRRVLACEVKADALLLEVQRFGQARSSKLEFFRSRDRRSPTQRRAARSSYQRLLARVLERHFPDWRPGRFTSAMDLERSFGPVHCRGTLKRGRSLFAALGVNVQEPQASIDASLTFALLWLDHCRERHPDCVLEGLKLVAPAGSSDALRARMAWLDRDAAKFHLYELDELAEEMIEIDCADRGNIATRLVQCPDELAARERFATEIARVVSLVPDADVAFPGSGQISFRLHGLEFARARLVGTEDFHSRPELTFGAGPCETVLDDRTEPLFVELLDRLVAARRPRGNVRNALFRLQPERWLEALVLRNVTALDDRLGHAPVYSQVPAFSASDRAMIDVLTATADGRLAVVELKAGEDIHLPLQGLDYWARVRWHQQRGEFEKFGYFSSCHPERAASLRAASRGTPTVTIPFALSPDPPLLFLVAPALHVHPATDALLRYLSPEIDCTLLGIDERWREGVRVIFRKRPAR
jgi:hypothetical protein